MKTRLLKTIHYAAIFFTIAMIMLLTLCSLLWALKPVLASETSIVESYLSQRLHHPVEIQSLSLDLEGLNPAVEIKRVVIFSPDHTQKLFSADVVSIGMKYFYINNMHLTIIKNKAGKWEVENLSSLIPEDTSQHFSKRFTVKGDNISLNFVGVFPKPIIIQHFSSKLNIEKNASDLKIMIKRLKVQNKDGVVTGKATLSPQHLDFDLKYNFQQSLSHHLDNYLPQNLLSPALLHWLLSSIKNIDSIEGTFVLQGSPHDFPYDHKPGKFLAKANLKNLDLKYNPEWPMATRINGELQFFADSMKMNIDSAEMSGVSVNNIKTEIPVLSKKAVLNINGSVNSDVKNMLAYISDSPLKNNVGKYFNKDNWQGDAQLQLSLAIPLTPESNKLKVDGNIALLNNTANLADQVKIHDISGNINFDEKGVKGKTVTGVVDNAPINVDISNVGYFVHYKDWKVKAIDKDKKGWVINFSHPQAQGMLKYKNNKLSGVFDYLYINKSQSQNTLPLRHPEKIPALNIGVNDFQYDDKQFGQVSAQTTPTSNGLILDSLHSRMGNTVIEAVGNWKNNISGAKGTLTSTNTEEMLKHWGLSASLESQSAILKYQINWIGNLYSPDLKTLQGNVNIKIGKGRIKHVGSQAQMDFGRLITILSFQSLAKKLQLDFSDLTKKGLNFDNITGDFVLNNGVATTSNTVIDGQVANIKMTGSIDIINETYHLKLMVTPDLTSSLPIIATIAGGPVAGAAAWAANKIINPIMNKITTDNYTITGRWDNPVIK